MFLLFFSFFFSSLLGSTFDIVGRKNLYIYFQTSTQTQHKTHTLFFPTGRILYTLLRSRRIASRKVVDESPAVASVIG